MIKDDEDYLIRRTYTNYGGVNMAFDLTDEELQATREMNKTAWESEIDKWNKEYLIERYKDLVEIEKENGELRERIKELEEENKKLHIDNEIKQLYENEMLGYMRGYENGRMGATGLAHKVGKEFADYLLSTKLNEYKEDYIKARKLLDDSIPKSKVKELIEKYKCFKWKCKDDEYWANRILDGFEELLEERN